MAGSIYLNGKVAQEYDDDRFGGAFGKFLEDLEVGTYLSLVDPKDSIVLDVGAGTGKLSIPLIKRNHRVVSMDFSRKMLETAESKALHEGILLKPVVCDAQAIRFPDESFDCVVSSRVLMHLPNWRKGIAEMCRVSRRSVVLDFPPAASFSSLGPSLRRMARRLGQDAQTYKAYKLGEVIKELGKAGFHVTEIKRGFFLPIGAHRRINSPALTMGTERLFRALGLVSLFGAPVTLKAMRAHSGPPQRKERALYQAHRQ